MMDDTGNYSWIGHKVMVVDAMMVVDCLSVGWCPHSIPSKGKFHRIIFAT